MSYFMFDIETGPDEDKRDTFLQHHSPPDDVESVEDWIRKEMSLSPFFGRIIGIGFSGMHPDSEIHSFYVGEEVVDANGKTRAVTEKSILATFWANYDRHNGRVSGYNILKFDLPFIIERSIALGQGIGKYWNPNSKPWDKAELDLMAVRWPPYGYGATSLKKVFASFQHEVEIPEEYKDIPLSMKGDAVYELWKAEEFAKANQYVQFDVWRSIEIYKRWKGAFF